VPLPRGFQVNLLKVESDGRTARVVRVITFRQEKFTRRVPNGNVQPGHGHGSDLVVRTLLNVPRRDKKRCAAEKEFLGYRIVVRRKDRCRKKDVNVARSVRLDGGRET